MTIEEYLATVVNKTWNKWGRATTPKEEVTCALLGLAGEVGEVSDHFKKYWFHAAGPIGRDALIKELGDVIFYWAKLCDICGIDIQDVLEANKTKLAERYTNV